ncbi:hypothetical protein A2U01_0100075, partial [Trifolium medium]|nr:hypothetical protein [Trifolium medium]
MKIISEIEGPFATNLSSTINRIRDTVVEWGVTGEITCQERSAANLSCCKLGTAIL